MKGPSLDQDLSLPPFRRVLAWAAEQGMSVRGQLTEEQLVALEHVFSSNEPWTFEHYQPLRAFAHALSRLNLPDMPALLNFGDVLQALDEYRARYGRGMANSRDRRREHLQRAGLRVDIGGHHAHPRCKCGRVARARRE